MTIPSDKIVYVDNHIIAVIKPAGLLTQSDHSGDESLFEHTYHWIKKKYNKQNNIFLGIIHRLDRNVSGIILFARTSKAASRLSKQFRNRTTKKYYRAIVLGKLEKASAILIHYLRKEKSLKTTVFPRETPTAKRSELSYKVIDLFKKNSLIEITLSTGRFHQIRAQMAFIGHPIMGDVKYGARIPLAEQEIALHANKLVFNHPISNEEITLSVPEPKTWEQFKV